MKLHTPTSLALLVAQDTAEEDITALGCGVAMNNTGLGLQMYQLLKVSLCDA